MIKYEKTIVSNMSEKKLEKLMAQEREERRSDSQYIPEFMKIPAYLFDESPAYDPDEKFRLSSIHEMMESDKDLVIDWEAVSVTYYTSLNLKYAFYEFPLPIEEPQAYYGMAVKYKGKPLVYYTLEMASDGRPPFFCKVAELRWGRAHCLIGPYEGELSAQAFMQYVLDYNDSTSTFKQE